MRWATLFMSMQTVIALDLVMLLVALGGEASHFLPALNAFIAIFDGSLVVSSVLLGYRFLRAGSRGLAAVFAGNLAIMAFAAVVRASGRQFPPWVFTLVDLYWLHLYLIVLVGKSRALLASVPQEAPTGRDQGPSAAGNFPGS